MKSIEHVNQKKNLLRIKSTVKLFRKTFKSGKVVDIGTRTGYAIKLLTKHGYDAIGTDIEPHYVNYATEHGLNVIVDDFMNTMLEANTFDLIYSRHVLEHCPDTIKFFQNCEKILKPKGNIFLTFPLQENLKGEHKVFYETINKFKKVLNKFNFNIKHLDYSIKSGIIPTNKEILLIAEVNNGGLMSYKKVTICEMLRQVNDLCQSDEDSHKRKLLKKAYKAAKKMNKRLNYYAQTYEDKKKDDMKWEDNTHKKEVAALRGSEGYKAL